MTLKIFKAIVVSLIPNYVLGKNRNVFLREVNAKIDQLKRKWNRHHYHPNYSIILLLLSVFECLRMSKARC
jgi:hypothetical protein